MGCMFYRQSWHFHSSHLFFFFPRPDTLQKYAHALRKKYLTENPLANVPVHIRFKQVVRKTGKTETYNTEEQPECKRGSAGLYPGNAGGTAA